MAVPDHEWRMDRSCLLPRAKKCQDSRMSMEIAAIPDGSELARGEETRRRHVVQSSSSHGDVMSFGSEERFSASIACDEQSCQRISGELLSIEKQLKIVMSRLGIPDLELDGLAGSDHGTDREESLGLVDAQNRPDQEITSSEVVALLIGDESYEQSVLKQIPLMLRM